jgi:hypothetical protein
MTTNRRAVCREIRMSGSEERDLRTASRVCNALCGLRFRVAEIAELAWSRTVPRPGATCFKV